ncbi:hypothetical protein [Ruminococcus albus]|uniref:Outer membrane lipoprotein-sorting protein n=1 Tax=Ruminococcus albus TaxID=1264 RepID=A0A1H7H682_RUMAL|nr:hypothetical protein [Ruminococcus albus]SEK45779.1 hypothetical protein SAMN05216469_102403 [Ruminococcus albus]
MRRVLIYLTAVVICLALSGCEKNSNDENVSSAIGDSDTVTMETADCYEDSLTKAFTEKLEGEKLTIDVTVTIDYENEKIGEDRMSRVLEVNGENRHLVVGLESGDIEFYQTEGKTWVVYPEKKEIKPLNSNGFFGANNAETVLGNVPESGDFVSAENFSDGNIREIFDIDGIRTVFTYDEKTGGLTDIEYETDSIPGDNKAVINVAVNSFAEDCGEIKLPEGYTMTEWYGSAVSQTGR